MEINFAQSIKEIKEDLENTLKEAYTNYFNNCLDSEESILIDIDTYINDRFNEGFFIKHEMNKNNKFYLFHIHKRTLLEIYRNSSNNYTVKKYIIDNNELENYIHWNIVTGEL